MKLIKVVRLGQPVAEYPVEEGTTFGAFLSANGIDASGRDLLFNGAKVSSDDTVGADGQLLLAGQTKGGI